MNEEAFQKFLKQGGRSSSAAKRVIAQVLAYEEYLREKRNCKELDRASPEDLEAFVSHIEEKKKGAAKKHLHSIRYYYEYTSNNDMRNLASKLRKQRIKQAPFPLKDFRNINPAHVQNSKPLAYETPNKCSK